jgi:hypothetical protein
MQRRHLLIAGALAASVMAFPVHAKVAVGQAAPDFTLTDSAGKTRSLSEFKGKTVVLEWNNPGCPFVKKHYNSGNIPKQQAAAAASGVVWLTINSGHTANPAAANENKSQGGKGSAYLLDADGKVGKLYGASTTPHVYVIDGQGVLRYAGGIDSIQSADQADIAKATQYIPQALAELAAGKAVSKPTSQPYGCSVKY